MYPQAVDITTCVLEPVFYWCLVKLQGVGFLLYRNTLWGDPRIIMRVPLYTDRRWGLKYLRNVSIRSELIN